MADAEKVEVVPEGEEEVGPVKLSPWKARIIDNLNPKLTNYSNPWLLALPIILLTFIVWVGLLIVALNNCQTKDSGMVLSNSDGHLAFVKENVKCVKAVGFPSTKTIANNADYNGKDHVSLEPCYPTGFFEAIGKTYCAGDPAASFPGVDFSKSCPNDSVGDLYAAYYGMEFCPTPFEAIGTSLAYTGFIEAFFTLIIVGVLMKTGVVRPLNKDATLFGVVAAAHEFDAEKEQLDNDIADLKARMAAVEGKL